MKRWLLVAGIALTWMSGSAFADVKIGVIDMRVVMSKSPQVAALNAQLEKEFKPRESKIADAQRVLKADSDRLERDAAVMSDGDRAQLQDKIIADRANMQGMIAGFRQDLGAAQNKAGQEFLGKVSTVVNKIAKDGKYDLIMQGDHIPYFGPQLDITAQVLDALKK